jgi:hypothetical protein
MLNHLLAVELARPHHAAPSTRRVQHALATVAWLVMVAAQAVLLVLETAGTRIP